MSASVSRADRGTGVPRSQPAGARSRTAPAPALERAAQIIRELARRALRLAVPAAIAGALAWWALYRGIDPGDGRTAVLVVATILLAFPPVALILFAVAARTLVALPGRLREAPRAIRERGAEISRRGADLTEARRRGLLRVVPALARLWWSVSSAREVLQVASPAVVLLTPATLVAAAIAVPAAVLEVVLGVAGLLWLMV